MRAMMSETLAGRIVIPMGLYGHADFPTGARGVTNDGDESTQVKQMLDRLHFAKINKANEILVVRVNGYMGSSTKREIAHAEATGKKVRYYDETQEERKDDGWRMLKVGEVIQEGDEMFSLASDYWVSCTICIGTRMIAANIGLVRRRISQPQGGDAECIADTMLSGTSAQSAQPRSHQAIASNAGANVQPVAPANLGQHLTETAINGVTEMLNSGEIGAPVPRDLEALADREFWNGGKVKCTCNFDEGHEPTCAVVLFNELRLLKTSTEPLVKERDAAQGTSAVRQGQILYLRNETARLTAELAEVKRERDGHKQTIAQIIEASGWDGVDGIAAFITNIRIERDEAQQWIDSDPDWKEKYTLILSTAQARIAELEAEITMRQKANRLVSKDIDAKIARIAELERALRKAKESYTNPVAVHSITTEALRAATQEPK